MHPTSHPSRTRARQAGRRSVRHRLAALVVVALAIVGLVPAGPAAASSDDKRREVAAIADQLESLQEELDQLGEDYVVALDTKARLDEEVAEAQSRIAAMEAQVGKLEGDLNKLAIEAFVSGGTGGTLTELFRPGGSPNDAVQMEHFTEIALDAGAETSDEYDWLITQLDEERSNLESKQAQAEALTQQIQDHQQDAESKAAEFTQRKAQAESELGQLLVEEEQRRQEEAARRAQEAFERLQREQQQNQSRPTTPSNGGSSGDSGGTGGDTSGGGDTGGSYPPPSGRAGIAVAAARSQLGVPYRFAAEEPGVAFDCSGLTKYAWGQAGVYLPHQSRAQFASTPRVPASAAQPGDLIYYHSPISHVGIYVGGGQMIHAPYTGSVVSYTVVRWDNVVGVTRPG